MTWTCQECPADFKKRHRASYHAKTTGHTVERVKGQRSDRPK